MANIATTNYKVTGSCKVVNNLWKTIQDMNEDMDVNSKDIPLYKLAEHYDIDWKAKQICVRGSIYWADYEEDPEKDNSILSFDTESAWDACNELFEEINRVLDNELSISYRVCECGCDVFYVHDEGNFFPEECCVDSSGEPFDDACEDVYSTIEDAIKEWTSKTGVEQGERTNDEMVEFINGYEYEDESTYFYIHPFFFE